MITYYSMAWNEELTLPFTINFYRARFPTCKFVIYDNDSTDATKQIALDMGCEVRHFESHNKLDNKLRTELKNNIAHDAKTDWVIICDIDEMLNITQEQLLEEEAKGFTAIKSEGWTLWNLHNDCDLSKMTHGIREKGYDKFIMYNKKHIKQINYSAGAHYCDPVGIFKPTKNVYKLLHYKFIGEDYIIDRYKQTAARRSQNDIIQGWSTHYTEPEAKMRERFKTIHKRLQLVDQNRTDGVA